MEGNFRIGEWRVQPRINSVRKNGTEFHLEPKVMQVLVLLSQNQGEVLSKDRLLNSVWPGVFVGEDVLTRSISEIRRVLGDDAHAPRFIQTIPKSGYRLIAPVAYDAREDAQTFVLETAPDMDRTNGSGHPPGPNGTGPALESIEPKAAPLPPEVLSAPLAQPSAPEPRAGFGQWVPATVVVLALFAGSVFLIWYIRSRIHPKPVAKPYRTVPLTSYPGSEGQAAFSPSGNQIAFVWNGLDGDNKDIYVKQLGSATPLRLTTNPADDVSPAWSPDGRFIAFIRHGRQNGIYIVPAIGGAERKIHTLSDPTSWEYAGVTWTKDGKNLIFPDSPSPEDPSALFSASIETLAVHRLTSPPKKWDGDWTPVVSPDGTKIAFIRGPESSARDVYVMNVSGQGEPVRLTHSNRLIVGLTWTPDSKDIVFSSNRDGTFGLWKVPAAGGTPQRLNVGGENSYSPAISPSGNMLAYTHGTGTWDIVRVDLQSSAKKILTDQILSSNEQDAAPQYSPDGKRIAFQSWRSGSQEIWTCAADGSSPAQLTSFGGPLTGSPRWSPDGREIAFDSRPKGFAHIFLISPDGGVPRQLTSGTGNDIVPSWSPDGKWVYFGSNRGGSWQVWKVASTGGEPRQLTKKGGVVALASPDGKWVYYTRSGVAGLWRVPADGGEEQQVLAQPPSRFPGYWALTKTGIYYLSQSSAETGSQDGDRGQINFASYADPEHPRTVLTLHNDPTLFSGLSVSPDQHWLVYADMAQASSNISLVENYH